MALRALLTCFKSSSFEDQPNAEQGVDTPDFKAVFLGCACNKLTKEAISLAVSEDLPSEVGSICQGVAKPPADQCTCQPEEMSSTETSCACEPSLSVDTGNQSASALHTAVIRADNASCQFPQTCEVAGSRSSTPPLETANVCHPAAAQAMNLGHIPLVDAKFPLHGPQIKIFTSANGSSPRASPCAASRARHSPSTTASGNGFRKPSPSGLNTISGTVQNSYWRQRSVSSLGPSVSASYVQNQEEQRTHMAATVHGASELAWALSGRMGQNLELKKAIDPTLVTRWGKLMKASNSAPSFAALEFQTMQAP